ncbi:MAG TPA: dTDP-4-dehydrorhamnose 3,5-epimerase [Polyangiaceae bacterium]|nr:dTDP-4-dehydrorhamnose 3,5-epimerase [Polyangiaceae bacterium]
MHVEELNIGGLKLISPRLFQDARGFFLESYQQPRYAASGIACPFVQTNHSRSLRGTLRGLHYQQGQAKLITVIRGRIFDVVVDLRPESQTFGRWEAATLDDEKHQQLFVPEGLAHGFCVVSDVADVVYQTTSVYDPRLEGAIRYDDHELAIPWPITPPTLSARDLGAESFAAFRARLNPQGGA